MEEKGLQQAGLSARNEVKVEISCNRVSCLSAAMAGWISFPDHMKPYLVTAVFF